MVQMARSCSRGANPGGRPLTPTRAYGWDQTGGGAMEILVTNSCWKLVAGAASALGIPLGVRIFGSRRHLDELRMDHRAGWFLALDS